MLYFHAKLLLLYIYRFKTVSGLTFCSNPQKPWVKRAIEFVDKKWSALETTAHLLNSAPTSKTTLTLDKASNWNGQDELKSTFEFLNKCLFLCTWLELVISVKLS